MWSRGRVRIIVSPTAEAMRHPPIGTRKARRYILFTRLCLKTVPSRRRFRHSTAGTGTGRYNLFTTNSSLFTRFSYSLDDLRPKRIACLIDAKADSGSSP